MHGRFVIAGVVVSVGLTAAAAAAAAAPGIGIVVVMHVGQVHWFWQLGAPVTVAAGAQGPPATASRRRESSGLHYSTNIDWCVEEDGRVCGLRVLLVVALR